MLLFGHSLITSERFYHINDVASIAHTPSNATLFLEFSQDNIDIVNHLKENDIHFALEVHTITEIIYANALGASFILVNEVLGIKAQKLAETYLFDAKILVRIHDASQIETLALEGVDGVIFPEAIIKITG